MLTFEYKLAGAPVQYARMDEAIRVAQFVRNKCLRLWMDVRGTSANDLQAHCSQLAKDFAFAAQLNSQARQAAADRARAAIQRFYVNCCAKTPGKKGYPRFQHDNRSVEYKVSGWKLDPDGRHLTFTDGCAIGRVCLVGTRAIESFPLEQIKRIRLVRRADGYYVQFCADAHRQVAHIPTGRHVGIDLGLQAFYTDSEGAVVDNPRFLRKAERRIMSLQRRLSRKSTWTKDHRKPGRNHKARKRQQRSRHPCQRPDRRVGLLVRVLPQVQTGTPPMPLPLPMSPSPSAHSSEHSSTDHAKKRPQSHNYYRARHRLARAHLQVQRQREDFARKTARALVSSSDLIAYEHLRIRNLVRNQRLAKSISDAAWAQFLVWVVYYAQLHGILVVAVPPQYTTQTCSGCGRLVQKTLSTRTHRCPGCGLVLDRDQNAAVNVLALGVARWQQQDKQRSTAGQAGTGSAWPSRTLGDSRPPLRAARAAGSEPVAEPRISRIHLGRVSKYALCWG